MSASRLARVVLGGQVWVIRLEYAERLAVRGVELWPMRSDCYDTTAERPLSPGGVPNPCCPRWASASDVLVGDWQPELGGSW